MSGDPKHWVWEERPEIVCGEPGWTVRCGFAGPGGAVVAATRAGEVESRSKQRGRCDPALMDETPRDRHDPWVFALWRWGG